jgi:hypothetical protein
MGVSFLRGQQLGREDLNIFLTNASGHPINAAEISYALYDFTTGSEVLLGTSRRTPANPSVGEYYASTLTPLDANLGSYRIRWTMREVVGGPLSTVVQEFEVRDRESSHATSHTSVQDELTRKLRMMLRDNDPDRNYRFRPPTHEATVDQYSKVFGYIWEDDELIEYMDRSLDMIVSAPPRTPFMSVDAMVRDRREWTTLLLSGAAYWAFQALQANWVADEFNYSIGGISLDMEKSSKYESLKQGASEQFDKMLEKAKSTVKYVKGLQQPKYGAGIRSSFGPYSGRSVLSPQKFMGV